MRILLLLPFHGKWATDLRDPKTGLPENQIHTSWYRALTKLGHQVKVYIYSSETERLDYYLLLLKEHLTQLPQINHVLPLYRRQEKLCSIADSFKPALTILSGNTDLIFPETLRYLQKKHQSKLVLLNGIAPVLFATKLERKLAPYFDGVFTNDNFHARDWEMLGAHNVHALPVSAIDPTIHTQYSLSAAEKELNADVAFVGSLEPNILYRDRIAILERIAHLSLKIWTPHARIILNNPKLRHTYMGEARGIKMYKIFSNAKISINIHGHTMPSGGNMRTFEINGCGGFQLVDHLNAAWYKDGTELVSYLSTHELSRKIRYYLAHNQKRIKITRAGFKRTHLDHTYMNRFEQLIKLVFKS